MRETELKDMEDKLTDMQSLLLEIRNDFKPGNSARGTFFFGGSQYRNGD